MLRIAIHSVPRSGSTWLGAIFDSHPNIVYKFQPLFSYAFKGYLDEQSSESRILSFFDKLKDTDDDFLDQSAAKKSGAVPRFEKHPSVQAIVYKEVRYHNILKNMLSKDRELKVVGLVRNPISTLYSWFKAPKEFRADLGWNFRDEWLNAPLKNMGLPEEYNGYEKWKEVAMMFESLKRTYPKRFYLLSYKDLLTDPLNVVHSVFEFCGLDVHSNTTNFVHASTARHNDDAYSVYKKKSQEKHCASLPSEIVDYIKEDLKSSILWKYLDL